MQLNFRRVLLRALVVAAGLVVLAPAALHTAPYHLTAGQHSKIAQQAHLPKAGSATSVKSRRAEAGVGTVQSANVVSPESYGAKGNGVTDDSAALQAAFDAARPGQTIQLRAGAVYAHSKVLILRVAGVRLVGSATLLATNEQTSSVWVDADNVYVGNGLTLRTAHTTQRWTAWQEMGLRIEGHSGVHLNGLHVIGSAAAGIYVGNQATNFLIENVSVANTRADGIHMTDGSNNGIVRNSQTSGTGDDGVAVVSYAKDGVQCNNITISGITVLSNTFGRGVAVVGGTYVTITGVSVNNTSGAGLYVASEGAPWFTYSPSHVTITNSTVSGANWSTALDQGAVLVASTLANQAPSYVSISGITITGTRPSSARNFGIAIIAQSPSNVHFTNFAITAGPAAAYQGNAAPGSFTTSGITHNGRALANISD